VKSTPLIIKKKAFDIKTMGVEEAAMQMDLLDKNFFVFYKCLIGRYKCPVQKK